MTPYAYTLTDRLGKTRVFPSLGEAVHYLILNGASASACRNRSTSLRAHTVDSMEPEEVDLSPYVEQRPVDEAAARAELNVAVADSRADYEKRFPHGRMGVRVSGDHWLCEHSAEELEGLLAREIERRSWHWKALT